MKNQIKKQVASCATYKTDLDGLGEHNIIVLDIGYSGKKKSCGIATTLEIDKILKTDKHEFTFAECIDVVLMLISSNEEDTLLILEAPISSCHIMGNPSGRWGIKKFCESKKQTCFEKQGSRARYWYYGAGAATYLAAHRFLTQLSKGLSKNSFNKDVYISEALLSFKKEGTPHHVDAKYILDNWDYEKTLNPVNCEPSLPGLMDGIPSVQVFTPEFHGTGARLYYGE